MKYKWLFGVGFFFTAMLAACGGGGPSTPSTPSTPESVPSPSSNEDGESEEHVHTFKSYWSHDSEYHWHSATCGHDVVADKEPHTYSEWVVEIEPTESSTGFRRKYCTVCNREIAEEMPPLEHIHTPGDPIQKYREEPECEDDGYYYEYVYCTTCEEEISKERIIIPALGHDFGNPIYEWNDQHTSCSASKVCTRDNYVERESNVRSTYQIITEPSVEADGLGRYTVTFNNSAFGTVTYDVVLPQLQMFKYSLNEDEKSYSVGVGDVELTGEVVIPSSYNDLPVTAINRSSSGFYGCDEITSVVLPDTIVEIKDDAFCGCSALESINIPDGVKTIGEDAFSRCSSLKSISVPDTVTFIGLSAFRSCSSLESITIPFVGNGVDTEDNHFFSYIFGSYRYDNLNYVPKSLKTITILEGCTEIGEGAFYYLDKIETINLPSTITSIGEKAFYRSGIKTINLPSNLKSISNYAFYGTPLTSITIPDGVTSIGNEAFRRCESLASAILPNGLKIIGSSAFYQCPTLSSVSLPDSLVSIGEKAFGYCPINNVELGPNLLSIGKEAFSYCSLSSINIPSSVTYIGEGAFSNCSYLTAINYHGTISDWLSMEKGGPLSKVHLFLNGDDSETKAVVIPESVTSLGAYAFSGCDSITSISIPESVTSIIGTAFYGDSNNFVGCKSLQYNVKGTAYYLGNSEKPYLWLIKTSSIFSTESLTIEDGCVGIYDKALYGNSHLKSVKIPNTLKIIGDRAFEKCTSLEYITIPDSVTYIGYGAFSDCVFLYSITVPFIGDGTSEHQYMAYIFGASNKVYVNNVVPSALHEIYLSEKCTSIPKDAFVGCTNLTYIGIRDTISYIDPDVFKNISKLTYTTTTYGKYLGNSKNPYVVLVSGINNGPDAQIEDGCRYIFDSAFKDCNNITSITIPGTVKNISVGAFSGCTNLASVVIGDGVETIGDSAFNGCTSLASISIPDSIVSISSSAFNSCAALQFTEYENALYLGNDDNPYVVLFKAKDHSITSCTVHSDCRIIYHYAFRECTELLEVNYGDSVIAIGDYAFAYCQKILSWKLPDSLVYLGHNVFDNTRLGGYATTYDDAFYFGSDDNPYMVLYKGKNTKSTVQIHEDCKFIYDGAFADCTNYTSITIPSTVIAIGNSLFKNCTSLKIVVLPDTITTIPSETFYGCTALKSFTISENVTEIGKSAFLGAGIKSIVLPDGIKTINESTFEVCQSLESIVIPNSVYVINNRAFLSCTSLKEVTIGSNVAKIGQHGFAFCGALEKIYFLGHAAEWEKVACGQLWISGSPVHHATCMGGNQSSHGF